MSDTTGGPAFPRAGKEWGDKAWTEAMAEDGMTLRDYFAAKAMQGLLSDRDWRQDTTFFETAYAAYQQADAMLKARGKHD
jgi:hypothetical protein